MQKKFSQKNSQSSQSPYKPRKNERMDKDEVSGRMEDFELDDYGRVSKPSQKILREMPQHKAQSQKTYKVRF